MDKKTINPIIMYVGDDPINPMDAAKMCCDLLSGLVEDHEDLLIEFMLTGMNAILEEASKLLPKGEYFDDDEDTATLVVRQGEYKPKQKLFEITKYKKRIKDNF